MLPPFMVSATLNEKDIDLGMVEPDEYSLKDLWNHAFKAAFGSDIDNDEKLQVECTLPWSNDRRTIATDADLMETFMLFNDQRSICNIHFQMELLPIGTEAPPQASDDANVDGAGGRGGGGVLSGGGCHGSTSGDRDTSVRCSNEPILVSEFVAKYINTNISTPLSDQDCVKVRESLKGIKVALNHTEYARSYKITGISSQPLSQLMFTLDDNLCRIVEGPRPTKRLNERQETALLRAMWQRPVERESDIRMMFLSNNYNRDELADEEFGIHVGDELTLVDKIISGGKVEFWTCVCFSTQVNRDLLFQFCEELVNMCNSKGMEFNPNPIIPINSANPAQIKRALTDVHNRSIAEIARRSQHGKQLQLLIIILPDANGSYGIIKRVCETELGVIWQCCHPSQASKLNKQYFENVALKINVKVGADSPVDFDV
ncbi:hypothetical protein JRO89_XS10G0180900 [Xanthoceras sorbifolium]|uniref:PAZ domain-containing protein n=1 Tax=Xanthoceras sorbifolium TaxID=99658 RepID=A0ABQ8HJB6_9ROSI|nr:hypothetical protein JRO89_XS10G0180900 [Xanthoceras sorbifolium]